MRQLVALLGLVWVAGNLLVAYLFVTSGLAAKTAAKGVGQQGPLILGGLLIGLFALLLAGQCVKLVLSSQESGVSRRTEQTSSKLL